jgi:hypothetical protein
MVFLRLFLMLLWVRAVCPTSNKFDEFGRCQRNSGPKKIRLQRTFELHNAAFSESPSHDDDITTVILWLKPQFAVR